MKRATVFKGSGEVVAMDDFDTRSAAMAWVEEIMSEYPGVVLHPRIEDSPMDSAPEPEWFWRVVVFDEFGRMLGSAEAPTPQGADELHERAARYDEFAMATTLGPFKRRPE